MRYKYLYESLSLIQKIEIYGIVLFCYIIIAILYQDIYLNKENSIQKNPQIMNNTMVPKRAKHLNMPELISYLENKSIQFDIDILDMKFTKTTIIFKIVGSFINEIHFLEYIQENFVILKCKIEKIDKELISDIVIDTRKYFEEEEITLSDTPNPFMARKKKKKKDTSIKIEAIIAGEVLIEGDWYKKGDMVKNYIVSKILDFEVLFIEENTHRYLKKEITNE